MPLNPLTVAQVTIPEQRDRFDKSGWFKQAAARAKADGLPSSYIGVLSQVKHAADSKTGETFVSTHTLAENMGCSVRTVARALRLAVVRGDLRTRRRERKSTVWTLSYPVDNPVPIAKPMDIRVYWPKDIAVSEPIDTQVSDLSLTYPLKSGAAPSGQVAALAQMRQTVDMAEKRVRATPSPLKAAAPSTYGEQIRAAQAAGIQECEHGEPRGPSCCALCRHKTKRRENATEQKPSVECEHGEPRGSWACALCRHKNKPKHETRDRRPTVSPCRHGEPRGHTACALCRYNKNKPQPQQATFE